MIRHPGKDLQPATFGVVLLDHRLIPASFSIHQVYGVTGPEPEHPDRVARFFFIQFCEIFRNTGTIKKTHDRYLNLKQVVEPKNLKQAVEPKT